MPEHIINTFKKTYGDEKGEEMYYKTAAAQDRNKETFKKESDMNLEQFEKELEEEMAGLLNGKGPFENQIPSSPTDTAPVVAPAPIAPIASSMPAPIASTDVVISGDIAPVDAPMATPAPSPTPAPGLPETVPGEVVPPAAVDAPIVPTPSEPIAPTTHIAPPVVPPIAPENEAPPEGGPIMEKKDKKDAPKVAQGSPVNDGGPTTKPSKQVHADKRKKEKYQPDWKKFDESVNIYISKTSRNSDIGVSTLEKMWKECVEEQEKGEHARSTRKFWLEVRTNFDRKVNDIFLQEAKKKMTERQKLSVAIEGFLENVAKDKYVEAKTNVREMVSSCVNSMISDRKVQYQKALAEEIAKKVREG